MSRQRPNDNPADKPADRPAGMDVDDVVRIPLNGSPLSLAQLDAAYDKPIEVELSESVWSRVSASQVIAEKIAAGDKAAYGINTGFGHLCSKRIPADQLRNLQTNLIMSHAVGVGPPIPPAVVRWMMLFKIHALAHGVSGISRGTLQYLIDFLHHDLLPVVPSQGSLGASGDLAPLAHMVLPMLAMGEVLYQGETSDARPVMERLGMKPVVLGPKEGLALINGTQFMSAYAAAILVRARRLIKHADIAASMTLESIRGSVKPFGEAFIQLRPHPGAVDTAWNLRQLMQQSQILASHADCARVQDPYSVRCVPAVHGASRDAIRHAVDVVETEINSVTDNPILLSEDEVVSGGLFHGQPLALVLDYLAIALAELGSISERRTYLLLSGVDDLPVFLMKDTGVNSGFMLPQYTAAALVSENKGLCMPSSVDSIPTSLGQEDHVSMGARSAVKCWQVLENVETVLAIEQLCAAQALDYRAPLLPGIGPRLAHAEIRKEIDHTERDHVFADDIQCSLRLLRSRRICAAVEAEVGQLR